MDNRFYETENKKEVIFLLERDFELIKVYRTEDKTKKIYRFLVTRGIKRALKEFNK